MLPTPAHTHNLKKLTHYSPRISSPLSSSPIRFSPISPLESSAALFNATMSPTPQRSPTPPSRESVFAKRTTKANPLLHGRKEGDGRETRRQLFLKRVREDSDEKRWRARGGDDEIMRTIWMAEQRRREERQAREAMGVPGLDAEMEELSLDEVMVDEVAQKEEEELEAILMAIDERALRSSGQSASDESIPADEEMDDLLWSSQVDPRNQSPPESRYGSDEEDYDLIFMDVIQEENSRSTQPRSLFGGHGNEGHSLTTSNTHAMTLPAVILSSDQNMDMD
ncbi:hypothetical protein B7494_g214 [Chlorociboria aeruginascens]|nr:hypothetical protein B7494_g214 [Chlorociboria aeruginascens]